MPSNTNVNSPRFVFTSSQIENDLPALLALVEQYNQEKTYDIGLRYKIAVIIDELVTNSILHGGCKGQGQTVTVSIEDHSDRVIIKIVDSGTPFDPTTHLVNTCKNVHKDVSVGGMGIYIVRQLALSMQYNRKKNRNHNVITIGKTK
jgi:anti-sigma regulatory factor (Ser/Thr protein kinase)